MGSLKTKTSREIEVKLGELRRDSQSMALDSFLQTEWVELEDVEKKLDEFKRKLQELRLLFTSFVNHIPKHERDSNSIYANHIWEINKRFEELLKQI